MWAGLSRAGMCGVQALYNQIRLFTYFHSEHARPVVVLHRITKIAPFTELVTRLCRQIGTHALQVCRTNAVSYRAGKKKKQT